VRSFVDRYYRYLRPLRPLYGWAIDARERTRSRRRSELWKGKSLNGAKLDICGGRNPFKPGEYLNVDIVKFPQVDLVFDITKRFPIEDGVIAEIISIATLEHLRKHHTDHVLREFFRVLQPHGLVRIIQPDIEAIARGILQGGDQTVLNNHLFGKFKSEETDLYDLHKWMYTADALMQELRAIGFVDVAQGEMEGEIARLQSDDYNYLIRARKAPKQS
jgi:predicted SAM-dependent methyltransferase